jgi:hypothetical protein
LCTCAGQNSPCTSEAATAATAATQSTGTKQVLTGKNLETMDTSTSQDSSLQPLSCFTKAQYEVSKEPREYQEELAEPRIRGENDIICMLIELTTCLVEKQCLPPTKQLQADVTRLQRTIMREQRMLVELKCSKCKITACRGSDIYRIDKTTHHVVPGEEFTALYEKFEHHSCGILLGCDNPIIIKDYKIQCSKCKQCWGVLGTWPSGIPYPIIKRQSFSFYVNGNVKPFKKWKDCPFNVPSLSEWISQSSTPATC